MKTYIPIDCNIYDILLAKATLRVVCEIEYIANNGEIEQLNATIINIYTKAKEEFMVLDKGLFLRLDEILSVDGELIHKKRNG